MDVQVFPDSRPGRGRPRSPTTRPTASTSRSTSTSTRSATGCAACVSDRPETAELRLTVDTPEDYALIRADLRGAVPARTRPSASTRSSRCSPRGPTWRRSTAHDPAEARLPDEGRGPRLRGDRRRHRRAAASGRRRDDPRRRLRRAPRHRAASPSATRSARGRCGAVGVARVHRPGRAARQAAPEVVSVATPDAHPRRAGRSLLCAAPSVRGVLAEKPLALDAAAARALVALARERASCWPSTTRRRFAPAFQAPRSRAGSAPARVRRLREGPGAQRHALARPAAHARG